MSYTTLGQGRLIAENAPPGTGGRGHDLRDWTLDPVAEGVVYRSKGRTFHSASCGQTTLPGHVPGNWTTIPKEVATTAFEMEQIRSSRGEREVFFHRCCCTRAS